MGAAYDSLEQITRTGIGQEGMEQSAGSQTSPLSRTHPRPSPDPLPGNSTHHVLLQGLGVGGGRYSPMYPL